MSPKVRVTIKKKKVFQILKLYGVSYRSGVVLSGTVTLALYCEKTNVPLGRTKYFRERDVEYGQGQIWRKGEKTEHIV